MLTSIRSIAEMIGLDFGALPNFDDFSNEERAAGTIMGQRITRAGDIRVWSKG